MNAYLKHGKAVVQTRASVLTMLWWLPLTSHNMFITFGTLTDSFKRPDKAEGNIHRHPMTNVSQFPGTQTECEQHSKINRKPQGWTSCSTPRSHKVTELELESRQLDSRHPSRAMPSLLAFELVISALRQGNGQGNAKSCRDDKAEFHGAGDGCKSSNRL